MVDVRARGYRGDAPGLLFNRWPSHVILIQGPLSPNRHRGELDVALSAYDVDSILRLSFEDTSRPRDQFAPTFTDVEKIAALAKALPERSRLLVLCPGGYGRSTAGAVIARVGIGQTPEAALGRTLEDRPQATPNRLMIALGDLALGCRGALWQAFHEWSWNAGGVRWDCPIPLRGRKARRPQRKTSS